VGSTSSASRKSVDIFRLLFVDPTHHGLIQFIRYGFTAIVAFTIDFGLLYVFTSQVHMYYLVSATSSFTISAVANYALSTAWVFAKRNKQQRAKEITYFTLICLTALVLNDLFMWLFTGVIHIYYLTSKLLTVAIVFFWSFAARRILFKAAPPDAASER
jgi:putative flippase GtrA